MSLFFWKQKDSFKRSAEVLPKLFNEANFYDAFVKDLLHARTEVIIESPYITSGRVRMLFPIFKEILRKGIKVYIVTRVPEEHDKTMQLQAEYEIARLESIGASIIFCKGNHHRKLAILDRKILWEGSLNILSQVYSREIMRRMQNQSLAIQMFDFLDIGKVL